jgi:protein-disulfide isomerase/uncharacterized membrane protein
MSFFKRDSTSSEAASTPERARGEAPPPPGVDPSWKPVARWRLLGAALLCLANTAVSGLLLLQHHGEERAVAAVGQLCGAGQETGCEAVARSPWSRIKGVPLAAVGVLVYGSLSVLLLLALLAGPEARAAAAALALLALALALVADLVLLGVQAVAIRAFCRLCLLTYLLGGLALVLLLPARRDGSVVGEAVKRPDGRLTFASWVLVGGALAVAVLAAELGLAARGRVRAATVLGPMPAASGAPTPSAASPGSVVARYQEEARVAANQARRLQELLDDPAKLEQYFAEKAAKEFDQAPVHPIKLDGVPVKGGAQAPIKVVEYADFLCPPCRSVAAAFDNYLPQTGGRVSVSFKNFPLDKECNRTVSQTIHPGACVMALGGLCAQEQDKFWAYHDRVFANPPANPGAADAQRYAAEAGLDATAFEACLKTPRTRETLVAQIAEGQAGGVSGTPTLFVNGRRLPRLNDFTQAVDKEAARLGLPPPPNPSRR